MHTKFKRHQKVRLLTNPDPEYIEYHEDFDSEESDNKNEIAIKKGMSGEINILLPNGQYHVEIKDKQGNVIAYCPMNEEDLEEL